MSDAMDHDAREVIRRRIEFRERDGHERLLLNHEALRALLDAADERDRLEDVERRMAVLLCNLTGGKLSKADYPVELMEQEIEEYLAGRHESDLRDERDRLAAQVERVRALHCPYTTGVLMGDCANESCDHEGRCPTVPFEFCGGCNEVAEAADPYYMERDARISAYPCPTARALDGADDE